MTKFDDVIYGIMDSVAESSDDVASATTIDSDSAWLAPAITVEQFGTEDQGSLEEIPNLSNVQGGQLGLPCSDGERRIVTGFDS